MSWRRLAVTPSTPTRVWYERSHWFGGVTRQVWVDNHKAAVTAHVPGAVRFNERFKQLARHYGFVPKACRPYRPRTKGKVERLVGYVKQHFFQRYPGLRELGASGPAPGGVAA